VLIVVNTMTKIGNVEFGRLSYPYCTSPVD